MRGASREALAQALTSFEAGPGASGDAAATSEISEGLYAVAALLDREPSLRRAFTDPASSASARQGLAERLLGRQLGQQPLAVFRDLVGARWAGPEDLREAVELLAAQAALRSAEVQGALDDVEDELFRFGRLLEREPQLRAALTDPGLPAERKSGLVQSLLGPRARPTTTRLVELAVTRPRSGSLESALEELSRLAAQRRSRYVARVRVAQPLDAAQETRLASSLARMYGRQVQLQVEVDPAVLGGVQVRVGDEVLDGTVRSNLDAVRRRLAS